MSKDELKKISIEWFNKLSEQTKEEIENLLECLEISLDDGIFALDRSIHGLELRFWIEKTEDQTNSEYNRYVTFKYLDNELRHEVEINITTEDIIKLKMNKK